MNFGLEALFEERLEVFPAEPSSILQSAANAEAAIKSLIKERDDLHAQVKDHARTIEELERRIYFKVASDAQLPVDVVRRLNRLENDCRNLRKDNQKMSENLKAAESETATLRHTIVEKAQKVKGVNKKIKNTKEVASKVEEKAKDAVSDKQRHLTSERKMRKERNDALAALSEQEKIIEDLRAELATERSGNPHLRDTEGVKSNFTTVVIPIEFRIRRLDYMRTLTRLRSRPQYFISMVKQWHQKWIVTQREKEEEVGEESDGETDMNYVDNEPEDKL